MVQRRFSWRALVGVAVAAVVLSTATTAVANHVFPDVSTDAWFHDAVDNVVGAGCATGFNNGTFGPTQNTTRGQFAVWMNRCAGRVTTNSGESFALATSGNPGVGGEVTMVAGAAAGATTVGGFVHLDGSVSATVAVDDALLCPCAVEATIIDVATGTPVSAPGTGIPDPVTATIGRGESDLGASVVTFPVSAIDRIGPEETVEYGIRVKFFDSDASPVVFTTRLTATYVPFGWDGGNGLTPPVS